MLEEGDTAELASEEVVGAVTRNGCGERLLSFGVSRYPSELSLM